MHNFVNTIDTFGDNAVIDSIIDRTITEFNDNALVTIGSYAFYKCIELTTIDLPNVTSIAYSAFYGCTALRSINIPAVTSIDAYNTFSECKSLTEVVLPACTNVGHGAFSYCNAIKVIDCATTNKLSIGNNAFSYCLLDALILRSDSVASLSSVNAFSDTRVAKGAGYIYAPASLLSDYKSATNWSTYSTQFRALEDYTIDGTTTGALDETKI